jgi:hypothetical protein
MARGAGGGPPPPASIGDFNPTRRREGGAPSAPEQRDDPTGSPGWRDRIAAARERHAAWLACVSAKLSHCAPTPSEEREDPMERLLNDDTLRPRDIVSTPEGLKVFRGQAGAPHRLEDFQ